MKRRAAHLIPPVLIVKLLRPINGDTHQEIVLLEKAAPVIGKQRSVGLNGIINLPSSGIFFLQFNCLLVETQRAHQRFTAVPGKQHLRHGLRLYVFFDELFEQFFTHHVVLLLCIQVCLLEVIAIITIEVTTRPYGFEHHI
ncbi:hypothetical protein SDC9_199230 [bioreactor metagenome]|uniref:Uncharacterized protein n=1 Tax=bioreactor metagenome TaxID=1076179 RepID=A0A645IL63_9ZZZZ